MVYCRPRRTRLSREDTRNTSHNLSKHDCLASSSAVLESRSPNPWQSHLVQFRHQVERHSFEKARGTVPLWTSMNATSPHFSRCSKLIILTATFAGHQRLHPRKNSVPRHEQPLGKQLGRNNVRI